MQFGDSSDISAFEQILSTRLMRFLEAGAESLDEEIKNAQREICSYLGIEMSRISESILYQAKLAFIYLADGITPNMLKPIGPEALPWCNGLIAKGTTVVVSSLDALPAEAAVDKCSWEYSGVKSCLLFPITSGNTIIGTVSFSMVKTERVWTDVLKSCLAKAARIFAYALSRKQNERITQENERQFYTMTGNTLMGVCMTDSIGRIVYANRMLEEMLGYSMDELTGSNLLDRILPEDRSETAPYITGITNRTGPEGSAVHYECRGLKKNGEIIYLEVIGTRYIRNGERFIYCNILDVTKHRESELKHREEAERYRVLLESTNDMIWTVEPENFCLVTWNPAFQRFFQESRGISVKAGMPTDMFMTEELVELWKGLYKRAVESGPFLYEYFTMSQTKLLILSFYPVIVAGKVRWVSVFGHDVTQLKKVEQALEREKEYYRALLESTNHLIWAVETKGFTLTVFNSAFRKYFMNSKGIMIRTGMATENYNSPETASLWHDLYNKAITKGKFSQNYRTHEGRYLLLNITPIYYNGAIECISVFAEDVTIQNEYKESLEASNAKILQRFNQTLNVISSIGELRDLFTAGHQKRVRELALAIAAEMGLPDRTLENILYGSILHDIGKMYVSSDILNKPGELSDLEFEIVKTHVQHSVDIASQIELPQEVLQMIAQHHERLDGSGYPEGLSGDAISLEGRILAVADVVEAMSTHRPYRPSLGIEAALDEIRRYRNSKYDGAVVDVCIGLFDGGKFAFSDTV